MKKTQNKNRIASTKTNFKPSKGKGLLNNKILEFLLKTFFIGGSCLSIWSILIYHETIIDRSITLVLFLVPGIFMTPIYYKRINLINEDLIRVNPINARYGDPVRWILHWLIYMIFHYFFHNKKIDEIKGNPLLWLLHYIFHICTTGSLIVFIFLASNFYFATDDNVEYKRFDIVRKDSISGRSGYMTPCVYVNYEGMEKELIIKSSMKPNVKSAKKVNLNIKKGFLGFDVIEICGLE